jgi:hypothetical protein
VVWNGIFRKTKNNVDNIGAFGRLCDAC